MAKALGRPLWLLYLFEPTDNHFGRPDPLDWSLRRQQARRLLARLRDGLVQIAPGVPIELVEGDSLETLDDKVGMHDALVVVGAPRRDAKHPGSSEVVRRFIEAGHGIAIVVPDEHDPASAIAGRIAVPVDGSGFAEIALTEASKAARTMRAELVLVHVVPEAGLAGFGLPDSADLELRKRLEQRNEQVACGFLERTRRRLADQGLKANYLCLKGDTRSTLTRAINAAAPDLVVLSARGAGGRHCRDLSIGSTASYPLEHLTTPVMLVRPVGSRNDPRPRNVSAPARPRPVAAA
jgi:nucleotide-binding universal stress UspA family protein